MIEHLHQQQQYDGLCTTFCTGSVGSCWGYEELDSMVDVVNNGEIPNRGCGCRCTQSVCVGSRLHSA